ncbi:ORF28 [callitrichine gammaherpesvirus 3]|uniref:ORF28 n=1 Tax=callitrichine gammaherpesvirus 3 TaxID=106331 RepID=Q993I2_9GAMA|nr:ORF28 [callitrichine gammaherpesvirus 3]AAK38236.1 ORF28 [callitrichine gammaherpesvirus 3]
MGSQHVEMEDPMINMTTFTFARFLRSSDAVRFASEIREQPRMPTMRYLYLYCLCKEIQEFSGDTAFCDFVTALIPENIRETPPSLRAVYRALARTTEREKTQLCSYIESMTRGQSENLMWDILRNGIISSSKLLSTLKNGPMKLFEPNPISNNHYVGGPIAFGLRCEDTVKDIICNLIQKVDSEQRQFGFMISPVDGIFGVSLDLCVNVKTEGDLTVFTDDSCIYEIKCRFKYLFSKSEFDPIYPSYTALYQNPSKKSFIRFINSIARPTIEYVADGRLPSESDYLLTRDESWNLKEVRRRKLGEGHDTVVTCLDYNRGAESMLYVMNDPSENSGIIGIKDRVPVDVFINPRHNYFYQVLLQYKIVGDYIRWGSQSKKTNPKPKVNIVTAFFRKRSSSDPALCTIGPQVPLDTSVEIPVAVLVTPIYIPPSVVKETLATSAESGRAYAENTFESAPWVPSSLFAGAEYTP